ncbi:MAG: glycosyltransferase family 2 protein [Candidatus Methylomirabilia bacterium]
MSRFSVAIITWNEEGRIRDCLESVAWADEVLVVDAESSDKTVEVAREFTDRIWIRPWPGFAAQKNFALDQTGGDWVLSLDADERVTPELRVEIERVLVARLPANGYAVPRKNFFWGAWIRHGGLYPDWQVRLFRRGHGRFVEHAVHESVEVGGPVARLSSPLLHQSYKSLEEFVLRSNRYSTLAAREWLASGRRARLTDLIVRPAGRFCAMYLWRRGFLDGRRGLLLATLYAHYVFLRTAKIWEGQRRRGED